MIIIIINVFIFVVLLRQQKKENDQTMMYTNEEKPLPKNTHSQIMSHFERRKRYKQARLYWNKFL